MLIGIYHGGMSVPVIVIRKCSFHMESIADTQAIFIDITEPLHLSLGHFK